MAKWNSGDASWHKLHSADLPLRNPTATHPFGFYFHQAPLWFHKVCCFLTFVVQMGAPFLLFLPRRLRHTGALVIMAHQILIALTGNYNFFNLLTISLCLSQLDDDFSVISCDDHRWFLIRHFQKTSCDILARPSHLSLPGLCGSHV